MRRWCDAVVDGNMVYTRNEYTVQVYNVTTNSWSQLPECTDNMCSVTVFNGWITTIGGYMSNKLFSLTGKSKRRRWTEKFPPMPTKRSSTTALCTETALIVAGGMRESFVVLSTVEVMDTESHQCSTAADLPQPLFYASATVCGDCIYLHAGGM